MAIRPFTRPNVTFGHESRKAPPPSRARKVRELQEAYLWRGQVPPDQLHVIIVRTQLTQLLTFLETYIRIQKQIGEGLVPSDRIQSK